MCLLEIQSQTYQWQTLHHLRKSFLIMFWTHDTSAINSHQYLVLNIFESVVFENQAVQNDLQNPGEAWEPWKHDGRSCLVGSQEDRDRPPPSPECGCSLWRPAVDMGMAQHKIYDPVPECG